MPNWCVTNWKIKGSEEDVRAFVDIINDLPNRPDVEENGFGKYWLKNLAVALGVDPDTCDNLRGCIDTDSGLCASWVFPESDEMEKLESNILDDGNAIAAFSTSSAWSMPDWLANYLEDRFEIGYSATDEFGNFHIVYNTNLFPWVYELHAEDFWEEYKIGEEDKVIKDLCRILEIDEPGQKNRKTLKELVSTHQDEIYDKEIEMIIYDIE